MKQKFFSLARKVSLFSNHPEYKLGSVLVNKNRVVSVGFNQIKTSPRSTAAFHMLHAEISTLLGLPLNETKGCTLYVYREKKDGTEAMSKPCQGCQIAIKLAQIKKICYTVDMGYCEERVL